MKKKKVICKAIVWLTAAWCLVGSSQASLSVRAQEQGAEESQAAAMQETEDGLDAAQGTEEQNQVMAAREKTEVLAEPAEGSEVVHVYEAGESVLVTGETADGWYQVTWQDAAGYVPVESLTEMDLDVEGLDEEFRRQEEEGKLVVEVVERKRAEARRARIWGTIIIVLVAGIFALGIYSAVRANREEAENKTEKKETDTDKEEKEAVPAEVIDLDKESAE